ncbi:MAG: SUMF1/EgtB/PvdO family nonheme iron enzyme [bacterium]
MAEQQHTRADRSYIKIATRILESPEFSIGPHSIARVEPPSSVTSPMVDERPAAMYVISSGGLASRSREFLALFEGAPTEDALRFVLATSKDFKIKDPICIAPNKVFGNTGKAQANNIWSPEMFFEHLVKLPDHFGAQLRDVATVQRTDQFSIAYQEREVKVFDRTGKPSRLGNVGLAPYLETWLSAHKRKSPVMLLGERGAGKSWALLQFAETAYTLHRKNPWQHGLVFFIRLSDLANLVEESSAATSVVAQYILTRYPAVRFGFGGLALLGALLRTGHSVVCVDGFDEMDILPSNSQVRARLTALLILLSKSTRFILTCRPSHFASLGTLFAEKTWGSANVVETFEILDLVPFDRNRREAYVAMAVPAGQNMELARLEPLTGNVKKPDAIQRALSTCARHPGLLAYMVEKIQRIEKPIQLLAKGIEETFVNFNLIQSRTREDYYLRTKRKEKWVEQWIDLSKEQRMHLLSDIAWYMAERGTAVIDLANLPPRLRLWYNIENEALERDLRSQTVFELVETESTEDLDVASRTSESAEQEFDKTCQNLADSTSSDRVRTDMVRFTLRSDNCEAESNVGESSVCGGYFLARYIANRLLESGPSGSLAAEVRLQFLGRVPLGPQTAALLREILLNHDPSSISRLGVDAWRLLRGLAAREPFRVYSACYRHIVSNLEKIGALSQHHAAAIEPWIPEVRSIVVSPKRLQDYKMVLVPPPEYDISKKPFLLGVHEVTNQHYWRFLITPATSEDSDPTVQGHEWWVCRITIAGSDSASSQRSQNYDLTNEYHLFFWLPTDQASTNGERGDGPTYRPRLEMLWHPVSYVSWYAAAAYCDWLTNGERLPDGRRIARHYKQELFQALGRLNGRVQPEREKGAFRLPTKEEWLWAARGGHDIERPWEQFPYYLPREVREADPEHSTVIKDRDAWGRYKRAQDIMRDVLLDSGKAHTDVFLDEANDLGVSGLIGNVREWCHDTESVGVPSASAVSKRLILGATGYLGEATFNFNYCPPLNPQNTNPDVGFRVARSLLEAECRTLQTREEQIAALPEALTTIDTNNNL